MSEKWFVLSVDEILKKLRTDPATGISKTEAEKRLAELGSNRLAEKKPPSALILFLEQFKNFIVWVLMVAAIISGFLGEWEDAIAIIAINNATEMIKKPNMCHLPPTSLTFIIIGR